MPLNPDVELALQDLVVAESAAPRATDGDVSIVEE